MATKDRKDCVCEDCGIVWSVRKDTYPKVCGVCASRRGGLAMRGRTRIARKPCPVCGAGIRVTLNQTYCSIACRKKGKRVERNCKQCGKTFDVLASSVSGKTNAAGNFCCRHCYEQWMCRTDRVTGRGSQWNKVRQMAKIAAPFCGQCGTAENLQVHHIVPFRITHDNSQNNLIPLCRRCHKAVEAVTHEIEAVETDYERMRLVLHNILATNQSVVRWAINARS